MHEEVRKAAEAMGLDVNKLHAQISGISKPLADGFEMHPNDYAEVRRASYPISFPKPSGTKERRKKERQNKKQGRRNNR